MILQDLKLYSALRTRDVSWLLESQVFFRKNEQSLFQDWWNARSSEHPAIIYRKCLFIRNTRKKTSRGIVDGPISAKLDPAIWTLAKYLIPWYDDTGKSLDRSSKEPYLKFTFHL